MRINLVLRAFVPNAVSSALAMCHLAEALLIEDSKGVLWTLPTRAAYQWQATLESVLVPGA